MINFLMKNYEEIIEKLRCGKYSSDLSLLNNIRNYVNRNSKNKEVIKNKKSLARLICDLYTKEEVIKSFNIPKEYKYLRQLSIIKNDPLFNNPNIYNILKDTIYGDSMGYFDDIIIRFLIDCKNEYINDKDFSDLINKIDQAKLMVERFIIFKELNYINDNKRKIDSEEEEQKRYIKVSINNDLTDPDYLEYSKTHKIDTKNKYINEKLNNISSLYLYQTLVPKETTFVSRDIGSNYGYDIYSTIYTEDTKIDALYTIKVTDNLNEKTFTLSKKEKEVMNETINNPKAQYILCYSYLDLVNKVHTNTYYKAIDMNTFKNIENDELFILDNNIKDKYTFISNKIELNKDKIKKID